ncbi:hypothetical protein SCOCK_150070 [Actinacidiphila cocklensis]|uniref:Uncharacterized protein n=1 Tax=Actinacidiphila cocklensis TaxID=887465 RepID=A0A9W4GP77_9ACTN|nr:hypothetical protein SCOCK_150070 [Actinacidiphila cocklensis]
MAGFPSTISFTSWHATGVTGREALPAEGVKAVTGIPYVPGVTSSGKVSAVNFWTVSAGADVNVGTGTGVGCAGVWEGAAAGAVVDDGVCAPADLPSPVSPAHPLATISNTAAEPAAVMACARLALMIPPGLMNRRRSSWLGSGATAQPSWQR